jgi:hypothetical protein
MQAVLRSTCNWQHAPRLGVAPRSAAIKQPHAAPPLVLGATRVCAAARLPRTPQCCPSQPERRTLQAHSAHTHTHTHTVLLPGMQQPLRSAAAATTCAAFPHPAAVLLHTGCCTRSSRGAVRSHELHTATASAAAAAAAAAVLLARHTVCCCGRNAPLAVVTSWQQCAARAARLCRLSRAARAAVGCHCRVPLLGPLVPRAAGAASCTARLLLPRPWACALMAGRTDLQPAVYTQ